MIINLANVDEKVFVYPCNGVNDDATILQFIQNVRTKGFNNFTVKIVGRFGKSETAPITVDNSEYQQITLDFSECNEIVSNGAFLDVKNVRVLGCSVLHRNGTGDIDIISFTGENSIFEYCTVSGEYRSGTCRAFSGENSNLTMCRVNVINNDGVVSGMIGTDNFIGECRVSVTSRTASAYGVDVTGSFVQNSKFIGTTLSASTSVSGNGGIGGGYFSNCQFSGFGGSKGQGFFIRGGLWLTMTNCILRGYTKDTVDGWGVGLMGQANDATTLNVLGINCNQISVSGYSQTKSFELLNGFGVYSGTFFTGVNVSENIKSIGAYVRNRA